MDFKKIGEKLKKNWLSIIFYAIIITLLVSTTAKSWLLQQVVAVGFFKADIETTPDKVYPKAAYFSFVDADGKTQSTSDFAGKVIFINVWASWCPPCRAEMPDLEKLYQKMKDDDRIVFLFLNEDQDGNKGIEYLSKNNFSMPFYKSTGGIPEEIFKSSLPTTVVINKAGEIVMKHHGVAGYNNDKFINQLKALL